MIAILPMAGRGSRFANKGYETPKPLIKVNGKPMFSWALQSLDGLSVSKLVIIALEEHEEQFGLRELMKSHIGQNIPVEFIFIPDVTEGQLCTVMVAEKFLQNEEPMVIIASDTLVKGNLAIDIQQQPEKSGGLISVASLPGDRWSFAKTDAFGRVVEVAEKVRISSNASTGIYFFK